MVKHGRIDPELGDGVVVYKSVLYQAFTGVNDAFARGDEAAIHDACDWFLTLSRTHFQEDEEWKDQDAAALQVPNHPGAFWDPEGPLPKETWRKRMAIAIHFLRQKGVLWYKTEAPVDEKASVESALKKLMQARAPDVTPGR